MTPAMTDPEREEIARVTFTADVRIALPKVGATVQDVEQRVQNEIGSSGAVVIHVEDWEWL